MLHITKTKQTRRKRLGDHHTPRKATRRSTPPFSPLLGFGMVGGMTKEEATNAVNEAYKDWNAAKSAESNLEKINKLKKAINNEEFDGNLEIKGGATLLGTLLYEYFPLSVIVEESEEEYYHIIKTCIVALLNKKEIIVDAVSDEGQSVISVLMDIGDEKKNEDKDIFKLFFDKCAAKTRLNGHIDNITDDEIKLHLLERLNKSDITYKDVIELCKHEKLIDNFYDKNKRVLTKEGKLLENELFTTGIFSELNSTNFIDDLVNFNYSVATSRYPERILQCNRLLKLLVGKMKNEDISEDNLDLCRSSSNESATSGSNISSTSGSNISSTSGSNASSNFLKDDIELINNFFETLEKLEKENKLTKENKMKMSNECGALILTTLIRTYESQIEKEKEDTE